MFSLLALLRERAPFETLLIAGIMFIISAEIRHLESIPASQYSVGPFVHLSGIYHLLIDQVIFLSILSRLVFLYHLLRRMFKLCHCLIYLGFND